MRKALSAEKLKAIYGHIAKRYDIQHSLITAGADQKGRRILLENAVNKGDWVLDCGAGTGTTGIMAAKKVGQSGEVRRPRFPGHVVKRLSPSSRTGQAL